MFANLFGKRKAARHEPDKIWKTNLFKLEGMLAFIDSLDQNATRTLVIAHFPDTFQLLSNLFKSNAISFEAYPTIREGVRLCELSEYQTAGKIYLTQTRALPESLPLPQKQTVSSGFEINVLAAEHHPLPGFDDNILEFAASLPCSSRVCFYDSIDGALIRHFGGDQIAQIMAALKLPERECISSLSINASIRSAQEKIARQVPASMNTDSAEQWFQFYMPSLK